MQHAFRGHKREKSENRQNSTYAKIPRRRRRYDTFYFYLRGLGKKTTTTEVELTGKAEMKQACFLAQGEARKAMFLPYSMLSENV